ncbi:MAG: ABC transporter ATP-binding protein [Clostridiales bacterium]|nr:ABC transporter ATP-binding protein [Clostridiales bacterium]
MSEQNNKKNAVEVENLYVEYHSGGQVVKAVNGISFTLEKGHTLGLVGETGAGKTSTALALMRLLPDRVSHMRCGVIRLKGDNIMELPESHMNLMRGSIISMIFQDPMTALNPIMTVGDQILEALKIHNAEGLSKEQLNRKVDEALELVGIPASRKNDYPLQFSGGMKQRVVIAIALACSPDILIADEPTTALDVTIQAQVLALIDVLKQRLGMSMIMISHDLGVVVKTCDDVGIMYAGELVEYGSVEQIYGDGPHHPYTQGLFGAIPNIRSKSRRLTSIEGLMPDPTDLPKGCKFSPRCAKCMEICRVTAPGEWEQDGHRIKCHLYGGYTE